MIYHSRCSVRGSSNAGESITLTLQQASKSFCILISRHLGFVAWLDLSCPVIIEAHWAWDHLCRCHQDAAYLMPCSNRREGQGGRVGSDSSSSSRYGREIFRSRSGITGSNHFLSRITRHIAVSQRMIQMNGLFAIVVVLCSRPIWCCLNGRPNHPAGRAYVHKVKRSHTLHDHGSWVGENDATLDVNGCTNWPLPTYLPAWLRYLCFGFWMSAQLNFRHDSLPPKTKRKKRTGCIKLNASTL